VLSGYSGFDNATKYPRTWPGLPSYIAEAKIISTFIADTAALKSKKACLLYQDDDFGRDAKKGFATAGMTFSASLGYNAALLASSGVKAQIASFAGSKCELVVVFGVTAATANAIGTAKALGFNPEWIASSVGADKKTLDDLGVPKALLTGVYSPNVLPVAEDTSDPYIALISKILTDAGHFVHDRRSEQRVPGSTGAQGRWQEAHACGAAQGHDEDRELQDGRIRAVHG
jgi:ABC-type branched-subunit amino acid transport system substrate-binding protein